MPLRPELLLSAGHPIKAKTKMTAPALQTFSSPAEGRAAARRKRLFDLQRIVWEMMIERFHHVQVWNSESEDSSLIAALRAGSSYVDQIEWIGWLEPLGFRIDGVDKNEYLIMFESRGEGFRVYAARVEATSIHLPGSVRFEDHLVHRTFREQDGFVEEVVLGDVGVDRAFLVGLSMVIGLMEDCGEDEDNRLLPLIKLVSPSTAELDAIASGNPTPNVILDEDDPY